MLMVLNMKIVKIVLQGVVRGTGFKAHIYLLAKSLGLKGYIIDVDEEKELICVEGDENQINMFLDSLDKGPPFTLVNSVTVSESHEPCQASEFEIYYREF
jgi:acylphosphatase